MFVNTVWLLSLLTLLQSDVVHNQKLQTKDRPKFDENLPRNITVQQGDTAYLHCKIFNAENM